MRLIYSALLYLISPLVLAYLGWRSLRQPAYRRRLGERFGWLPARLPRDCIWIHAASVGEVRAVDTFVRQLRDRYPSLPLLVTTMTPTGAFQVSDLFGDNISHCYVPFDLPHAVRAFLGTVRPRLALVVEMELWPNLFHDVRRRGIPFLLVNARLSPQSARGYRRLGPLMSRAMTCPDRLCAQSSDDAHRLREIGAPPRRVVVTGSLKFDQQIPASAREHGESLRRELGTDRHVWIAASTREGEEEQVLAAFDQVRETVPDTLLVLVPRHPERFARVATLCRERGYAIARRSEGVACSPETTVYLGDTMGELPVLYAAADVAFVGGSLVPLGAHNLLEPAALGLPVLVGPHTFNFAQITRQLIRAGGCDQVADADLLADAVIELLEDPARRAAMGSRARELVKANRGAVERMLAEVDHVMTAAGTPPVAAGSA